MRKIISLATVLAIALTLLTSCGGINVDKYVDELKAIGLTEGDSYTTNVELGQITDMINTEIEYSGGDFVVRVKEYKSLTQYGNYANSIQFITFVSNRQAKAYEELYISSRGEYSSWRVAREGKVVVITNLDIAVNELDLEFK